MITCVDYCKEQNLNSELDCFHSKSKTLAFLENVSKGLGIALVSLLVADLADSYNIGKNMSAPQVTQTAKLIVYKYSELKLDDLAFCFTKAKMNGYGKVFDRLDTTVIFEWVDRFCADKLEQITHFWEYDQIQLKSAGTTLLIDSPPVADDKTALTYIREISKTVNDIHRKNRNLRKITTAEPVKEYLIRDIHQIFMRDFMLQYKMETWADENIKTGGIQFITCCGKKLDLGEYIEKKHRQLMAYREKINYRWGIHPEPNLEDIKRMMKGASDDDVKRMNEAKNKGLKYIPY